MFARRFCRPEVPLPASQQLVCCRREVGLRRDGGKTERDTIAVVEIMTGELERDYWSSLRKRLERDLPQEEIVIRAQQITQL